MNRIGSQVASIRVEALLGEGGMGQVYRGFDEKLQRPVALKTLRPGHLPDEESKARFLREARVLSRLAHPSICQIYDLIEADGGDFLVLEYVEGRSLEKLLEERRLSPKEALDFAVQILEALEVAHRERIVHRDLKPANLMLTPKGTIKILDFGIARLSGAIELASPKPESLPAAAEAESLAPDPEGTRVLAAVPGASASAPTRVTRYGMIVGTVRYMSPEQAAGLEVTEASDLFSLGILLQELLTGSPAYAETGFPELHQAVLQHRSLPLEGFDPDLCRFIEDLKHPNPQRRPTASQALERVRWLLDKPQRERQRRWWRWAAAAAGIVLVAFSALALALAWKAQAEAERAEREARAANRVVDFLVDLFEIADPEASGGRVVPVQELLTQATRSLAERLQEEPELRQRLDLVVGGIAWRLGETDLAIPLLERAHARMVAEASDAFELARARFQLGAVYLDRGRLEEAESLLGEAAAVFQKLGREEALAETLNSLGVVDLRKGRVAAGLERLREALSLAERARLDPGLKGRILTNLALGSWHLGELESAELSLRSAVALLEQAKGRDHVSLLGPLNNLGLVLKDRGEFERAVTVLERARQIGETALGVGHTAVAAVHSTLGDALLQAGKLEEAEKLLLQAEAVFRERLGSGHPDRAGVGATLAELYLRKGALGQAELWALGALRVYRAEPGYEERVRELRRQLERIYRLQGRSDLLFRLEAAVASQEARKEGAPPGAPSPGP